MGTSEHLKSFTDDNFEAEVLNAKGPVLVDFWAEWCGPCQTLGPTIEEVAKEFAGKASVGKLDVDANTGVASRFKIMSIPTVMVFRDGKPLKSIVGLRPKSAYTSALQEAGSL